ncbi:MAG: hypothetical protein ACI4KG_07795 [Oscillospiraceae bacterium]
MKKKIFGKVAAVSLAGLMTVPTVCIAASAELKMSGTNSVTGTVYEIKVADTNGILCSVYYTTAAAAAGAAGGSSDGVTEVNVTTLGATIYVKDGKVTTTNVEGSTAYKTAASSTNPGTGTGTHVIPATYRYASGTAYYSAATDTWYPNLNSLYAATGSKTYDLSRTSTYSTTNCYFDPASGYYVASSQLASCPDAVLVTVSDTTETYAVSVYKVGNTYYTSYSAAYSAAGGVTGKITHIRDYTTIPSNYFSQVTGSFYNTYASALSVSNGNAALVTVFNGANTYYYNYLDPYYYYWYSRNNDSSSSDTTTATIGSRKGWTSVAKYIKSLKAGSSTTVDMNTETVVPSTVIEAFKGKDVTVKFVLDNGVTFTVNGEDVTSAKSINLDTEYNTKNVPSKLVKAAYNKNDAVSSAQLSIAGGSLGFESSITVKFSTKRAGNSAKLYRYNASKNSLVLVDSAKIQSNGKCTFTDVTTGGDFVIVIY